MAHAGRISGAKKREGTPSTCERWNSPPTVCLYCLTKRHCTCPVARNERLPPSNTKRRQNATSNAREPRSIQWRAMVRTASDARAWTRLWWEALPSLTQYRAAYTQSKPCLKLYVTPKRRFEAPISKVQFGPLSEYQVLNRAPSRRALGKNEPCSSNDCTHHVAEESSIIFGRENDLAPRQLAQRIRRLPVVARSPLLAATSRCT